MTKVAPLKKMPIIKKKTTKFKRFHSNRFLRVAVLLLHTYY